MRYDKGFRYVPWIQERIEPFGCGCVAAPHPNGSLFIKAYGFKEIHPLDGVRRQTSDFSVHRRRRVRLANLRGVMIAAWIITGASLLLNAAAIFVAYKWRESYYQAYGLFKKYNEFIKNGARELSTTQEIVDNDFNVGKVHVEATGDNGMSFVIKTFIVENPHDKDDVEFAIREAEELIETIQKA